VRVAQLVGQSAVHAERLELQPDEAESVGVEEHEEAGRALGAGEAVARDLPRPVEAGDHKTRTSNTVSSHGESPGPHEQGQQYS